MLGPKQKKEVAVSFRTDEAKVIIATIVIKVQEGGSELARTLKMSAIGKYPFITLDQHSFDFETLLVGKTASQVFNLQNASNVSTHYVINKVNDDEKDTSIKLDRMEGNIAPGEIVKINVTYTSQIAGVRSFTQFKVAAFGGNELDFTCKGMAEGFDV